MKTIQLKAMTAVVLLGAALAAPVLAQGSAGSAAGSDPAVQTPTPRGQGMGPGAGGRGMRGGQAGQGQGMMFNQNNTRGWGLMTPQERTEHQAKMRGVKTYDECKTVQAEQHAAMEARAKEKGVTLPIARQNACDRMKARGIIQ